MFAGKNTRLKQAAVSHAIKQAVRSRAVIASFQICPGVQLHIEFGSRFFIETFTILVSVNLIKKDRSISKMLLFFNLLRLLA